MNFIVKKSKIHNLGLFAARRLLKDEELCFRLPNMGFEYYKFYIKDLSELEKTYFFTTERRVYSIRDSVLKYINHSETPNVDWEDGPNLFLIIKVLMDIRKGSEIFINYGWEEYPWNKNAN
jgi:SET domain-containing protein